MSLVPFIFIQTYSSNNGTERIFLKNFYSSGLLFDVFFYFGLVENQLWFVTLGKFMCHSSYPMLLFDEMVLLSNYSFCNTKQTLMQCLVF